MKRIDKPLENEIVVVQLAPGVIDLLKKMDQKLDKIRPSKFDDHQFITPREFREKYRIPRSSYGRYVRDGILTVYSIPGTSKKYLNEVEVIELIKSSALNNDGV